MAKLLSLMVLVLMLILLIPTGLVIASQNSVQGERMYPVKRNLEQGILLLAGLTPWTKAYFQVGLSDRRFNEVKTLIARGDNAAATLTELLAQTNTAVSSIEEVDSLSQKVELQQKLLAQLNQYDQVLVNLENQQVTANPHFTEQPPAYNEDPFVFEQAVVYTEPTAQPEPVVPPKAVVAPTTSPKPSPVVSVPTSSPSPTPSPTPKVTSSPAPVVAQPGASSLTPEEIKKAKEEIRRIQERVKHDVEKKEEKTEQKKEHKKEQKSEKKTEADVIQSEP